MKLSVVIPTYNGQRLLQKNLPAVVAAKPDEIIIVDDASTDSTASFLKTNFPQVNLIRLSRNRGFARAVNAGVKKAQGDIVVLFNNDVKPQRDCLLPLAEHFKNPTVFSVGFLETTGSRKRGKSIGFWRRGLVHHAPAKDLKAGPTLWTFAASAAYRKSTWDKLGGLDPLFRPAYWEDIDLSYRAKKQGWQVIFDPSCQVNHQAESTMKPVLGSKITAISYKNQLLFVWKNITSLKLIISHLLWLPYHLIFTCLKSRGAFFLGLLMALLQLPEALIKRFSAPKFTLSDEAILA